MLKKLVKLADFLDSKNLNKEANYLDQIIQKTASGWDWDSEDESSEEDLQPIKPLRVPVPTMKVPIQEDTYDRYFEEDLQPIVEEYDEGVLERRAPLRSDDEEFYPNDEEYRFNVRGPHTRALKLDIYDFFPDFPGSRDELIEALKDKNSNAMDYFQERIMSQDLKANRERRRNRE